MDEPPRLEAPEEVEELLRDFVPDPFAQVLGVPVRENLPEVRPRSGRDEPDDAGHPAEPAACQEAEEIANRVLSRQSNRDQPDECRRHDDVRLEPDREPPEKSFDHRAAQRGARSGSDCFDVPEAQQPREGSGEQHPRIALAVVEFGGKRIEECDRRDEPGLRRSTGFGWHRASSRCRANAGSGSLQPENEDCDRPTDDQQIGNAEGFATPAGDGANRGRGPDHARQVRVENVSVVNAAAQDVSSRDIVESGIGPGRHADEERHSREEREGGHAPSETNRLPRSQESGDCHLSVRERHRRRCACRAAACRPKRRARWRAA